MGSGTIAFLLGVLLCQQLPRLPEPAHAAPLLLVLFLPVLLRSSRWRRGSILAAWLTAGFLWAALRAAMILSHGLPPELEGHDLVITGQVSGLPEADARRVRFEFETDGMFREGHPLPVPGRVRLSWYGGPPPLEPGQRWRLTVRLKRPHGMLNPGGFDYESWLFQHRIRATGYVREGGRRGGEGGADDGAVFLGAPGPLDYPLQRWRQRLRDSLSAALPEARFGGLIRALAIGDRQGIGKEQWDLFRATGTSHLMAISGLHIGLIAGLAFFLVRWLWALPGYSVLRLPAPRAAAVGALAAAGAYAALAGFSIPTQRALVMVAAALAGPLLGRAVAPGRALTLALLAVLIFDPLAVLSAGFWLSFTAVAVILFGMRGRLGPSGRWWRWGRVQWLAAIGLLPLSALYFGQAAVVGPVANLIAIPWIGLVVLPLVLAGTALLPLGVAAATLPLHLADTLIGWLWPLLQGLAAWGPSLALVEPGPWTLGAALAGTAWWLAPRGWPARHLGLAGLLPLLVSGAAGPPAGQAWLTLLDVGQGLSVVVRTARHALVYDTGPRFGPEFDTGSAVVVPYLRHIGVTGLDLLVISHGDNDHIGGARSLLAQVPARQVLSGVPAAMAWAGARSCRQGQRWEWDGVRFEVLHPLAASGREPPDNDGSCVLRVSAGGDAALLTGDIEAGAERELLETAGTRLHARILVAPHHGSKTSSTPPFVKAVAPEYVLFPIGYRNRYGFPRPAVRRRYKDAGAASLDSAACGAITVRLAAAGSHRLPECYRRDERRYWNSP